MDALFDADPPGRKPTLFQSERHHLIRVLIFFPGKDMRRLPKWTLRDLLQRPVFFKRRRDEERLATHRQHHYEQPFAVAPIHTAEIQKRSTAGHCNGIQFVFLHQALRPFHARQPLFSGDGMGFGAAAFERRDRRIGRRGRPLRGGESGDGKRSRSVQKSAASEHRGVYRSIRRSSSVILNMYLC